LDDAYATKTELKGYADNFTDTTDDTEIDEVLLLASRAIDQMCDRQFNSAGVTASARVYHPDHACRVTVHDFSTTTDLVVAVDLGDDGTYETTLASTDYALEPLNGIVDAVSGWPYYRILLTGGTTFPIWSVRPSVQVTARWGWAAVPKPIKIATIYLALESFKLKGAPFGVANFDQFGPIRVRENPRVMAMIAPYRKNPVLVG